MIGSVQEPPGRPSVAAVTDALGRVLHHQANVLDLVSPTPGRVLFGVAVTIRFLPYREDLFQDEANSFARCFYAAIGNEPQGKVVVFDSAGYGSTSRHEAIQATQQRGRRTDDRCTAARFSRAGGV